MSSGKLCGLELKISQEINGENSINVKCDLYEGHDGECSKMFYHCKDMADSKIFKHNYRVGRIKWKKGLAEQED